ncbi:hypothetical protein FRC12_020685 [Ceratobasidium sp. 428]|nr:hypothetical protein FRC12_020685 [Ceratobasidium sp. 428]
MWAPTLSRPGPSLCAFQLPTPGTPKWESSHSQPAPNPPTVATPKTPPTHLKVLVQQPVRAAMSTPVETQATCESRHKEWEMLHKLDGEDLPGMLILSKHARN